MTRRQSDVVRSSLSLGTVATVAAVLLPACWSSSNPAAGGGVDGGSPDATLDGADDAGNDGEAASLVACLAGVLSAAVPAAGVSCASQTTSSCKQCVQGLTSCAASSCPSQFQACGSSLLSGLYDAGAPPVDASPGVDASLDAAAVDSAAIDSGVDRDAASTGTDLTWAQWPIPNSPVDTQAGAPNPQSYTNNDDGTITDGVTGLMWQQTPTDGDGGTFPLFAWTDAQAYCTGLSLAGHADWRLPTVIELSSILNYDNTYPAALINATAFPGTPTNWFWSSTPTIANAVPAWAVHFGQGLTGLPALVQAYAVRCVRGGVGPFSTTPAGAPPGRYTTTGTGAGATVYDTKTLLTWQQAPVNDAGAFPQMTYPNAVAYCAGITLNGQSARLPTVGELLSLADYSNSGSVTPSIDPTYFPGTPVIASEFWASTPALTANNQWYVNYSSGGGSNPTASVYSAYYVRCVH